MVSGMDRHSRTLKARVEKTPDGSLVLLRRRTCHPISDGASLELHIVGFLDRRNCNESYVALNYAKPAFNAPNNSVFEAATYPQIRVPYGQLVTYRQIKD